jgi:hypothetical protein
MSTNCLNNDKTAHYTLLRVQNESLRSLLAASDSFIRSLQRREQDDSERGQHCGQRGIQWKGYKNKNSIRDALDEPFHCTKSKCKHRGKHESYLSAMMQTC